MHCISKFTKGAFIIAVSMLLFASCKRSSNTSPYFTSDDNGGYASDASNMELITDQVISIADIAGNYGSIVYLTDSGSGASISVDTISVPHQLNIRFGTGDVKCLDGRTRSGTITVYYNGEYTDAGQVHTINFENYTINDNALSGYINYTRVDTTVTGNWYYNVQADEQLNVGQNSAGSQVIIWNGSLVRKWISGYTTGTTSDDEFSISGNAVLTRANGNIFTFDIATPLQVALDCNYVEAGVVDVSGTAGGRILNYGSGSCDPEAQVTLDQDNSVDNITLTAQ